MIYLAEAVDLSTNKKVNGLILKEGKRRRFKHDDYKFTVLNEFGKEITRYNVEKLHGAYFRDSDELYLTVVPTEYWGLYKYLSFEKEISTGYPTNNNRPGRNIGCVFHNDSYYFYFDYSETLGGILINTDYWDIKDDILTVHCYRHDILYKIREPKEFSIYLTKLKVLKGKNR